MRKRKSWLFLALIATTLLAAVVVQGRWLSQSYQDTKRISDMNLARAVDLTVDELTRNRLRAEAKKDTIINGILITDSVIKQNLVFGDDSHKYNIQSKVLRRREVWSPDSVLETEDIRVVVDKLVNELSTNQMPLSARINGDTFRKTLQRNLQKTGIFFPVEYGVYNTSGILDMRSAGFDSTLAKSETGMDVFREDILWKPALLKIQTPGRKFHLLRQLSSSAILSFIILLIIAIGIGFIYKQYQSTLNLMKVKTEFISNMSHELKTPVATIGLAIRSLQLKEPNSASVAQMTGIMEQETGRMKRQIDRMLDLALLEKNGGLLHPEIVSVRQIISHTVEGMQYLMNESSATCEIREISPDLRVLADPFHLECAIRNILENSIRYARKGVMPEFKITTQTIGNKLRLRIADNGEGIPEDKLDQVFEAFYRVHSGNVHETQGTGLGLAYAKSVITGSGGQIYAARNEPEGTIITIELPLANHDRI